MRFMMFMYPDDAADRAGARPSADDVAQMMKYNEELAKAGVLIALDGLHPSDKGARVSFPGGKPKVADGPFPESAEVVGGYWMIQCKSRDEAIEWAKRVPPLGAKFVEVRQVFEMSDFPVDVQAITDNPTVKAAVGAG
ncbi:MAG: YciI family protein [Gemmatimonadaceae bacterium]